MITPWLQKCYGVYKDGIKFKTEKTKKQETRKDEKLVFQKNRKKMQTYISPYLTKYWPRTYNT